MWLFPYLTLARDAGIVAVLVQMGVTSDTRSQLLLSLLSWGIVLAFYALTRWRGGSISPEELEARKDRQAAGAAIPAQRIVVLANQTMQGEELNEALHRITGSEEAEYLVVVPANPVDTGTADYEGAAFVWEATTEAAQARLDQTLGALSAQGLSVEGELGDYRPIVALDKAMREFHPDHVVISTHPEERSTWLRHGVVSDARERYSDVSIEHVVVQDSVPLQR